MLLGRADNSVAILRPVLTFCVSRTGSPPVRSTKPAAWNRPRLTRNGLCRSWDLSYSLRWG